MLFANLFDSDFVGGVYEEDVYTDAKGKFLLEKELPSGRFNVVVRVFDENNELKGETMPYVIEVDPEQTVGKVTPHQLDDQPIDLVELSLLMIENSRPLLYGTAPRDYEVQTMWASELFSSSLMENSISSFFRSATEYFSSVS